MTRTVTASDWHDEWSPETPVRVRFAGEDADAYLSTEAAIGRLGPSSAAAIRRGDPVPSSIGSIYQLLTEAPE